MAPAAKRKLTHIDQRGNARMVDVGAKLATERVAIAKGEVHMLPATLALLRAGNLKKGDVFSVAQVAGVLAAKRTADLIPLCHPLRLTQVDVQLSAQDSLPGGGTGVLITATARTTAQTGVEMEALTAVAVAALTVYDMTKSAEKTLRITNVRLVHKRGGASGVHNE